MSLVQFRPEAYADLAHLVERNLAKVEVAGPSPVIRLETAMKILSPLFLQREKDRLDRDFALRKNPVYMIWKRIGQRTRVRSDRT